MTFTCFWTKIRRPLRLEPTLIFVQERLLKFPACCLDTSAGHLDNPTRLWAKFLPVIAQMTVKTRFALLAALFAGY